ncbi:UNVERIFIED_CONTAM: hypothetical protein NCL1_53935 [Trichonephila clavipes]
MKEHEYLAVSAILDSLKLPKDKDVNNRKVVFNYPLLKESDMTEEMKTDTMDLCVTSYEKHSSDHEYICTIATILVILYELKLTSFASSMLMICLKSGLPIW